MKHKIVTIIIAIIYCIVIKKCAIIVIGNIQVILIPQARVLCLIYTHAPSGLRPLGLCVYIRQSTSACGISAMYHIAHAG